MGQNKLDGLSLIIVSHIMTSSFVFVSFFLVHRSLYSWWSAFSFSLHLVLFLGAINGQLNISQSICLTWIQHRHWHTRSFEFGTATAAIWSRHVASTIFGSAHLDGWQKNTQRWSDRSVFLCTHTFSTHSIASCIKSVLRYPATINAECQKSICMR